MKFLEIWSRVSEVKSFKGVNGQADDGRGVIKTAHPEPSAQVS